MGGAVAVVLAHQGQASNGPVDVVGLIGVILLVLGVGLFLAACVRVFTLPRQMVFLCITLFAMASAAFYVGMYPVGVVAGAGIVATVIRNEIRAKERAKESTD